MQQLAQMDLLPWSWTVCKQRKNQKMEKASQRTKMDPKEENQRKSPKVRTKGGGSERFKGKGRVIRKHATYVETGHFARDCWQAPQGSQVRQLGSEAGQASTSASSTVGGRQEFLNRVNNSL